jgi:lysophospholipase L1-like esterase
MRDRLGKLLLVVGSVVVTWVVADLVLLFVFGPVRTVEGFYEPDPQCGYRMKPNLEFVFASPYHGYEAVVRTNELGLRDDPIRVPKPVGTYRVLLLGDSMTAGLEVDKDATFEAVCERLLTARRPTDVVNSGVRGYNLDNIIGSLQEVGLKLDPDLVVYVFTDNDLTGSDTFQPETTDASRGFTLRGFVGRIATYSHITYRIELLRQRIQLRRARDHKPPSNVQELPGGIVSFFTVSDWQAYAPFLRTAQRIEYLAHTCAEHGIPFVLAGAPQREAIDPKAQQFLRDVLEKPLDFDGMSRYLDWVATRLGVERFDPTPEFRRRLAADGDYWFHKDGHLNVRGHRLMGELLAAKIEGVWSAHARTGSGSP